MERYVVAVSEIIASYVRANFFFFGLGKEDV